MFFSTTVILLNLLDLLLTGGNRCIIHRDTESGTDGIRKVVENNEHSRSKNRALEKYALMQTDLEEWSFKTTFIKQF